MENKILSKKSAEFIIPQIYHENHRCELISRGALYNTDA